MNNSVYGKTMENVEKRKDVKITEQWENKNKNHLGLQTLISKPNFVSLSKFADDLYAVELKKMNIVYDKPIYLGFVVLELSKWIMYEFHYGYMKPKYKNRISLNYMDTDSFIYTIQTDDFYEDIRHDIYTKFDTSNYHPNNPYNLPLVNKKVLGMMKDENNGKIMIEFVGLRAKMYAIKTVDNPEIKKSKGVKKYIVDKLTANMYKRVLFEEEIISDDMVLIRSNKHQLHTQSIHKIVLSYDDDKRLIMADKIHTLARGHYRSNESKIKCREKQCDIAENSNKILKYNSNADNDNDNLVTEQDNVDDNFMFDNTNNDDDNLFMEVDSE